MKRFVIKFNNTLKQNIVQNGLVAGEWQFNTIFPMDKGFAIDWYTSANYHLKQKQLLDWINLAIIDPSVNNFLLSNYSLNGYNTRAIKSEIASLSYPNSLTPKTEATVTFDQWIIDGIGKDDIPINFSIQLKPTPSYSDFQGPIKDNIAASLKSIEKLPTDERDLAIKKIICEQLNQLSNNIPDTFIPFHDKGRCFEPSDFNSAVIVFNDDESVTIKKLNIGPADDGIAFPNLTINPINADSNGWLMYLLIGVFGFILAIGVFVLIYIIVIRKRKNHRGDSTGWTNC